MSQLLGKLVSANFLLVFGHDMHEERLTLLVFFSLAVVIYFSINVGLFCMTYMTRALINLSSLIYKQWVASNWQIVFYIQIL